MVNIFTNPGFGIMSMSSAINIVPNLYGRLELMGLFPIAPRRTRIVGLEMKEGRLNLLPPKPVGGPATRRIRGGRNLKWIEIPHIPYEDQILAADVVGSRKYGTDDQLETVAELVAEAQVDMAKNHFVTLEFMRWGALTGQVLAPNGDVIIDFYDLFDITPTVIDFELDDATTEVTTKILELKRHIELNLKGETMTGVHVFVDSSFFDKLTTHPKVKAIYDGWASSQPAGVDYRTKWVHMGVTFEEHVGSVSDAGGTLHPFIEEDTGLAFPMGTRDVFATEVAPAEFIETVNTPGQLLYSKTKPIDYDRGIDIWTESNPLPVCKRPALLVKLEA